MNLNIYFIEQIINIFYKKNINFKIFIISIFN